MDFFTAMLFTTTFRGQGVAETVTKLKDMPECRLIIKRRMETLSNIDIIYVNKTDVKSFRYKSDSNDWAYQNLNCVDLTKGVSDD